jgi:hypothetical protein
MVAVLVPIYFADIFISATKMSDFRALEIAGAASKSNKKYDSRNKTEVILDYQAEGKKVVPVLYPYLVSKRDSTGKFFSTISVKNKNILLLAAGPSNTLTVMCNEGGYYVDYVSDARGFRNPPGSWGKGNVDFILLGDSYTHGSCVEYNDSLAGYFASQLPKSKILNLGVGSSGGLLIYARLQEYGHEVNARNVLWLFFEGNDIHETMDEFNNYPEIFRYFKDPLFRQSLSSMQKDIDKSLHRFAQNALVGSISKDQIFDKFRETLLVKNLRIVVKSLFKKSVLTENRPSNNDIDKYLGVVRQAKNLTEKQGAKFYFVYLPWLPL